MPVECKQTWEEWRGAEMISDPHQKYRGSDIFETPSLYKNIYISGGSIISEQHQNYKEAQRYLNPTKITGIKYLRPSPQPR